MRILSTLLILMFAFTVHAQEMHMQQYARLKKGLFNKNKIKTDKKLAILDLKTSEQGFTFKADGKTELAPEEGEGILTLTTPDKTKFIVINHPKFGQLSWKVPGNKGLRKKKRYAATLLTLDPDEEYKLQKQWVVFDIQPSDAIVTIDSTTTIVHNGRLQQYLALGKHQYKAESPFYTEVKDSFELTDERELCIPIVLQPIYSYLTVKTAMEGAEILIDGQRVGWTQGTSGHLSKGNHRVVVNHKGQKYYDAMVNIGWQEKKTIELTAADLQPIIDKKTVAAKAAEHRAAANKNLIAMSANPVAFQAMTDSAVVAMDQTKKTTYYGMINVHSNEIGADVYVDGKLIGTTPCIVKQLPAGRTCKVRLTKAGFHDREMVVMVEGNDLADVRLDLKKKKGQRR